MSALVSIVLPTYNRAHLLEGAVRSCLDQSWSDLELVIVDDGSTDATPEIAAAWARRDARVRCVRQQNGKIPRALNAGFRAARGELFTWTSDDNLFEPDAVERMASYLLGHPEVGLVYCDTKTIDESGHRMTDILRFPPSDLWRLNVVGPCFMYRRSVAERVGEYDTEAFLAEDYDYWLRISRVAPLAHLEGVTPYRFRQHGGSLSSTREAEVLLQAARVRAKHAASEGERRSLIADGHCAAGMELRKVGRHRDALGHYARAIRLCPWRPQAYRGLLLSCLRHRTRMPFPSGQVARQP